MTGSPVAARIPDIDLLPGDDHVDNQFRLLARELVEHLQNERVSLHVSRSFAQMDAAGHHLDDQALVLAIASRESSPRAGITMSDGLRCSDHNGGLDDAWGRRDRLHLLPPVRRRLRPATDVVMAPFSAQGDPVQFDHLNESGAPIRPAGILGSDQLILYASYVLRAQQQLRAQVRNVFESEHRTR